MKINFFLILFLFNVGLFAQNLTDCGVPITSNDFVINGGFEQVFNNQLPNNIGQLTRACNWIDNANNWGTPDYFHQTSFPGNQAVNPDYGGSAYAGFGAMPIGNTVFTEIIATELSDPLQANRDYILRFDVSRRAEQSGTNHITFQAFLSNTWITGEENNPVPTTNGILLTNPDGVSTSTTGWDTITIPFTTGSGGQQFLYIGAFSNTQFENPNAVGGAPTYYYVDNVSLIQGNLNCTNITEFPDCNNSANSDTFNICGNFTTISEDYQLSINVIGSAVGNPFGDTFTLTDGFVITNVVTNNNGTISGEFCREIDWNIFDENLDYQISTRINSNANVCIPGSNTFQLPFNDCETEHCEDLSLNITTPIPNCEDLNAFGSFPVTASITLPPGYTQNDAVADITANNFTLDISDLNNPDTPFITLNSSDINNGTFGANVMELTYLISSDIISNMSATSYIFQFNADLTTDNGVCQLSDTIEEFSLVGCTETNVDLYPISEGCGELGDSFSLSLCGNFSTSLIDNAFLQESLLLLEIIHSSGNSQIINVPLSIPFASDEFCFTVTEADLPYGLIGNYDFRVIGTFSDDNSPSFIKTDLESGISFEDCSDDTVCVDNPALEDLLATNLKNILNAILDLDIDNGYTGLCASGYANTNIDITYMPEVIQFMQEYNLEARLQNAIDIRENQANVYYPTYTANITHVYYKWGVRSQGNPPCLSISFRNQSINETGPFFYYVISGGAENGGYISEVGLDPTLIQEFTNIEIDAEQGKATFDYIGIDGQPNTLYDILYTRSLVEGYSGGLKLCWFHDLWYSGRPVLNDGINLYPNPTKNIFYVSIKDKSITSGTFQLKDGFGNKIVEKKYNGKGEMAFNLSELSMGLYFIYFTDNNGHVMVDKVIKK